MTETERSEGSKIPVKLTTVRVSIVFRTGDTEFGVIDVTTAGPALIVKVWLVSVYPLMVRFIVTDWMPWVNSSVTQVTWLDEVVSTSQGVPSLNVILIYVPSVRLYGRLLPLIWS